MGTKARVKLLWSWRPISFGRELASHHWKDSDRCHSPTKGGDGNRNGGESEEGTSADDTPNRKALTSLFRWDELVTLLGFSKEDIANKVSEAVERLKVTVVRSPITKSPLPLSHLLNRTKRRDRNNRKIKPTPSEHSRGTTLGVIDVTRPADGELTVTALSLFDDDIGMTHTQ